MEIVEEPNVLHISYNFKSINDNSSSKNANSAGRPKQKNVIKFGPEPKSIVSMLLNEKKTPKTKDINDSSKINQGLVISEVAQESLPKSKFSTKSYICEYPSCTYKTTSSSNMIKHKRRHTSEKPYMCDQCIFRTNFINSLKVHKRIHSGERPFVCEHCSYRCNSSSNLKKHHMHKHSEIT